MYKFTTSPRTQIVAPTAGQRATTLLENNVQTHALRVTVRGTVTIGTASATAILNGGSILAAFTEVGIRNGADLQYWDPLVARFASEAIAPQALSATRLTALTVGAYALAEQFTIPCAVPYALNPRETAMMERSIQSQLEFFIKQDASAAARIATAGGGGGTVVLSGITVDVTQEYNGAEGGLPFFQPRVTQLSRTVSGSSAQFSIKVATDAYLRAIIITQRTTGGGLVSDILNSFKFISTGHNYVGPELVNVDDFQRATECWAGGDIYTPSTNAAHVILWFQKDGRLSNLLTPGDTNLQLVCDVDASAGAGTSELVVHLLELVRDPYVGADGRRIVTPELPLLV